MLFQASRLLWAIQLVIILNSLPSLEDPGLILCPGGGVWEGFPELEVGFRTPRHHASELSPGNSETRGLGAETNTSRGKSAGATNGRRRRTSGVYVRVKSQSAGGRSVIFGAVKSQSVALSNVCGAVKSQPVALSNDVCGAVQSQSVALSNVCGAVQSQSVAVSNVCGAVQSQSVALSNVCGAVKSQSVALSNVCGAVKSQSVALSNVCGAVKSQSVGLSDYVEGRAPLFQQRLNLCELNV